jgi:hypothetical protein
VPSILSFTGWGAPVTADAGYRGKLSNINLGGDLGISHMAIDKNPKIQGEIERAILGLSQTNEKEIASHP